MNTANPFLRATLSAAGALLRPGRVPPLPSSARSILVVRQHDQLGDMICAVPAIRALRSAWPGAAITLVASPVNHDVMLHHPLVDRLLLYDKREIRRSPRAFRAFLRALREGAPDIAVVPSTVSISLTSGLIARLSGAPVRIGPGRLEHRENPAEFLYTHPVDLDWREEPARHQTLRNADVLAPLGLAAGDTACLLGLTPEERRAAAARIEPLRRRHGLVVGLHPGAAKPGNRWPPERFAALAAELHRERGCAFLVTVGPRDAEQAARLLPMLAAPHETMTNEPIRSVAALIDRTDLFVSNDTGPLHIAGALGPPSLGLFGPTDPRVWAPPGRKNHFVRGKDGTMESIEVEEVLSLCRVILSVPPAATGRND